MTGPRRLDVATALREALEDQRLRVPDDEALRPAIPARHPRRDRPDRRAAARDPRAPGPTATPTASGRSRSPCAAASDATGPFEAWLDTRAPGPFGGDAVQGGERPRPRPRRRALPAQPPERLAIGRDARCPRSSPIAPTPPSRAGPEAGRGGMGDLTAPFPRRPRPPRGADPRQWRADPAGVAAASAALRDPHARAVLDQRLDAGVAAPPRRRAPGGREAPRPDGRGELARAARRHRDRPRLPRARPCGVVRLCRGGVPVGHRRGAGGARRPAGCATPRGSASAPTARPCSSRAMRPVAWRSRRRSSWCRASPAEHGGQPHGPGAGSWCVWPEWLKRPGASDVVRRAREVRRAHPHRHRAPRLRAMAR